MRCLGLLLVAAAACSATGEPVLADDAAFDNAGFENAVIDVQAQSRRPVLAREPVEPDDEPPDRRKSLIIMDLGDEPGFWRADETDRLPLELRLHSFGNTIHIEVRNAGRERVYWCGPDLEDVRPVLYGESADGALFLPSRCAYEPSEPSQMITVWPWSTLHTLGPGEAYPLATIELTRTAEQWVTAWMEDTLICLFVPVDAVLRAGMMLTSSGCGKIEEIFSIRIEFAAPDPATGFPQIVFPWKLNNLMPPTAEEFEAVPAAEDRISNGIRIYPAERPFEGPALRRARTRKAHAHGRPRNEAPEPLRRSRPALILNLFE